MTQNTKTTGRHPHPSGHRIPKQQAAILMTKTTGRHPHDQNNRRPSSGHRTPKQQAAILTPHDTEYQNNRPPSS
ncbi:hypothetical protein ACOMHN_010011 [Nucella lapillus]